jgi:hypothetical protein
MDTVNIDYRKIQIEDTQMLPQNEAHSPSAYLLLSQKESAYNRSFIEVNTLIRERELIDMHQHCEQLEDRIQNLMK